jgi:hypothetical protein
MKAKDLAALAALGVAGFAAYDKFGKKKSAQSGAKEGAKLGESERDGDAGEREARMNMRDMNEGSGRRDAGGNTVDVDRRVSAPERMGANAAGSRFTDRDATDRDVPEVTKKSDADARAAYAKLKAAGSNSKTPAAALQTVSRSVAATPAAAAAPAAAQAQPIYDNDAPVVLQKPDATRVNAYNPDIMYNTTVKSDPNVEHDAEMNRLAQKRATRQGTVVAQTPNAQAQARILRQGPTPAQSATNAQAQARLLRQGAPAAAPSAPAAQQSRYTKDKYGNIIDNTTGKVSRTIFSAGQEGNAARVGMKRGGMVKKMASGGMTSSKPSTASSRGDGCAQRGKTRGQMR